MRVSAVSSEIVYRALKDAGVEIVSALPETRGWVGPTSFHMDVTLLENRYAFARAVQGVGHPTEAPR